MKQQSHLRSNQKGLVSIIVTMIVMVVLSLIVLGFAQLARREQRQALDRQLNTEAQYAAESGVNDARKLLLGLTTTDSRWGKNKDSCDDGVAGGGSWGLASGQLVDGVKYSCILITQRPTSLEFGSVGTEKSTIVPIISESGNYNSLTISWQRSDTTPTTNFFGFGTGASGYPAFPTLSAATPDRAAGLLRIDLIPINSLDRTSLINNTFTAFLYPGQSGSPGVISSVNLSDGIGAAKQGALPYTSCDNGPPPGERKCKITINMDAAAGASVSDKYYLRMRSVYSNNSVTITATTAGASPATFVGGQAVIDSTGRARDVLQRVQVRVPLTSSDYNYPDFAVDSGESICKRLSVAPGIPADYGGCAAP